MFLGDYSWIIILLSDVVGPSCMLTVFICPLCCIKRRFHKYLYIWGEISWQAFQPFCRRNVSATKKSQGFEFVCLLSPRQPSIFPFCEKWKLHWLSWRKTFFHKISVITFNLLKSKILPLFPLAFYDNCWNHCSANKISPPRFFLEWQFPFSNRILQTAKKFRLQKTLPTIPI